MKLFKFLFLIFTLLLSWSTMANKDCELDYLIGPPSDVRAHVHTKPAKPSDFTPDFIKSLKENARQLRFSPIPSEQRSLLRLELEARLQVRKLKYPEKVELETALALVNDPIIGKKVRGFNVKILHPLPWEYLPPQALRNDFAVYAKQGYHVRKIYELDVELSCCIIEVTTIGDMHRLLRRKERQLKRLVNINGRTDFINPDGKKVILYVPNFRNNPGAIPQLKVTTTNTIESLMSEIKKAL